MSRSWRLRRAGELEAREAVQLVNRVSREARREEQVVAGEIGRC